MITVDPSDPPAQVGATEPLDEPVNAAVAVTVASIDDDTQPPDVTVATTLCGPADRPLIVNGLLE